MLECSKILPLPSDLALYFHQTLLHKALSFKDDLHLTSKEEAALR